MSLVTSPADAVSPMTSQCCALAIRRNSVSITVFPKPRCPVTSIMRPGAPTPLVNASEKSSMMECRPIRIGGILPAVGLKGLLAMTILLPTTRTHLPRLRTILHECVPNYTKLHHMTLLRTIAYSFTLPHTPSHSTPHIANAASKPCPANTPQFDVPLP